MPKAKRKAASVDSMKLLRIFNEECAKLSDEDYGFDRYQLTKIGKIGADLKKVNFDFENCDLEPEAEFGSPILGLRRLYVSGGYLNFIGMSAGGDWEHPVYFIVYLDKDGKTLRAYVPKDGNNWNYKTKEAFGNDEEGDAAFLKAWIKENRPDIYDDEREYEADASILMQNDRQMARDIESRIEVVKN